MFRLTTLGLSLCAVIAGASAGFRSTVPSPTSVEIGRAVTAAPLAVDLRVDESAPTDCRPRHSPLYEGTVYSCAVRLIQATQHSTAAHGIILLAPFDSGWRVIDLRQI